MLKGLCGPGRLLPSGYCRLLSTKGKHADVVIVGGAVMGSSIAFHLKTRLPTLKVTVVERDMKWTKASTSLSCASIRQQFSLKENIELSSWSYKFISSIGKHLKVKNEDAPDISLVKRGYLFLASEAGQTILEENVALQQSLGCKTAMLSVDDLKQRYPWLCVDKIAAGSIGTECEGHFDGWSLMSAFKKKCVSLGVTYIEGDVKKLSCDSKKSLTGVTVETQDGTGQISCGTVVNAGGPWAAAVTNCIGISLPVEPRKRYVFVFKAPNGPSNAEMPMMIDSSGIYCRPEGDGNVYITGRGPVEREPDTKNLDVDYEFFDDYIWPTLAERVPTFDHLKVQHSWAGYYEYNTVDQNAIIGAHPYYKNLFFANGFSGHGIQQSPAVGNAIAELIIDGKYTAVDLSRLSIDRILKKKPLPERNII